MPSNTTFREAFVAPFCLRITPGPGVLLGTRRLPARVPVSRRVGSPLDVKCVAANAQTVLDEAQLAEWAAVTALVRAKDSGLGGEAADKLVARAFGWGTQKFWRGRVKQQPPSLEAVQASLQFLTEVVGVDEARLPAVLKTFPEVLAMSLSRMTENVAYIQRTYPSLKGNMLRNAVVENPAVLGYDFDCEGDCKSECARCWVQF